MFVNRPDAQTRAFLARLAKDLAAMPAAPGIEDRRRTLRVLAAAYGPKPAAVARIEDVSIPGPAGAVAVRLYFPNGMRALRPLPLVLHIHGGGWALGDPDVYANVCRAYCAAGHAIVADVHYRRAPEHKFPAALEDCEAALAWLAGHGKALGGDASRIAVTGDSAGGCLAAVLCARTAIPLALQILLYPMTTISAAADYPSRRRFGGGGFFLTQADIARAKAEYLSAPEDGERPDVSPLLARDLSHAPPALIVTPKLDPLRDEGADYARALKAAGVGVEHVCVPRTIHGCVLFAGALAKGRWTIARIGRAIRTVKPRKP